MRDRLLELISYFGDGYQMENRRLYETKVTDIADYLLANGVNILPCKIGDTVYKICPKCNEWHNASCEHCAWRGCHMTGCDIGVRVYSGGSYNELPLQIVPRYVSKGSFVTVCELWNTMYFATEEEANTAKEEYEAIRNIQDRNERYEAFKAWEAKRERHYAFFGEGK